MLICLSPEFKQAFPAATFADCMALTGDVYRALEGRKTQRIHLNHATYFIKQHTGVGWKEIFKNLIQGRLPIISAKNEWLALQRLKTLNVAAPESIGFGACGWNPAHKQSFLITRALPQHISLEHLCQTWLQTPPSFAFKYQLIKKVADIAKTLHENGMNHRDFYICHFLLDVTQPDNKALTVYLIDLHRAHIRKRVPVRWRIKDLAGLYFSSKKIGLTQRDILRFIKKYRNKPLREELNKETKFWLKVKERGDQLYAKNEQSS